ncbi:MAG: hypothetical protein V7642_753 [Burkholderiales bacterium]|jgi:hypothetical protein
MERLPKFSCRGGAAVEFILCLPLLILLALPVIDVAQVVQANMILTSISREGANLASRTARSEQAIMEALAATALPLAMRESGMVHITKVLAHRGHGVVRNVVIAQHRWSGGTYAPAKGIWTCGAAGTRWDSAGTCADLPAPASAPAVDVMHGQLADGDVIYVVEAFYRFPLLFSGLDLGFGPVLPRFDSDLYAMTVF